MLEESVVGKSEEAESQYARIDDRQFARHRHRLYVRRAARRREEQIGHARPDEVKKRKSKWTRFVKASYWKSPGEACAIRSSQRGRGGAFSQANRL